MHGGKTVYQRIILITSAEEEDPQVLVFPTLESLEVTQQTTVAAPRESGDHDNKAAPEKAAEFTSEVQTMEPETLAPQPPRGDGPANRPQV